MSAFEQIELAKQVRVWSCIDLECAQRHSVSVASHGCASVALERQDRVQAGMVERVLGELVEEDAVADTIEVGTSVDCANILVGRRRLASRDSDSPDLLLPILFHIVLGTKQRKCNKIHMTRGGKGTDLKRKTVLRTPYFVKDYLFLRKSTRDLCAGWSNKV